MAENLAALDAPELALAELQLLSGLATLAEPLPPGDGFVPWRNGDPGRDQGLVPSGYVKIAMENHHRNSGFSH